MGTICSTLAADLFLFCYEGDFICSCCLFLTIFKQMLLKHLTLPQDILMTCFILIILISNKMVNQLNKASPFDTEPPFWTWICPVTSKIHKIDKRGDIDFEIVKL